MLQKLTIRNYAIIDRLSIEPDAHLNTVTGETGAGKSIILGALSLILGERADTSVLINKEEKCVVEAIFEVTGNKKLNALLAVKELDEGNQCIIRREIAASGKSRAFINDTPVTINVLSEVTSVLVDLHQQFDHLVLEDDNFQINVLDAIAQNNSLLISYASLFAQYRKCVSELKELEDRKAQFQKESDYKQFLFNELEDANFSENEIENADVQLKQMGHAERILSVLQAGKYILQEGEQPLINELRKLAQQLQGIEEYMPALGELNQRLNAAYAELKDIAGELEAAEDKVSLDPTKMQQLTERHDLGNKLLKKHNVASTAELIKLHSQLKQNLKSGLDLEDDIERLRKDQIKLYSELLKQANQLSEKRNKVSPDIEKKVNELLALVGMPNARFKISSQKKEHPIKTGMDDVQFLLDANNTGQFLPVHKAASGGEMSRIMLCIKSLTAKAMEMPTLIFDEVDTGISGEAARQVGILLRDLAKYHQVICITHQPQVAAKGSRHFYVYKDADAQQRITTKIKVLQPDERVLAIARMIGGEQPSDAALQNARELVN